MTQGIGGTAVSQGYEMLAAKLAKNQPKARRSNDDEIVANCGDQRPSGTTIR